MSGPIKSRFSSLRKVWKDSRIKKLFRWYKPGKLWGVPVHIHISAVFLLIFLVRGLWALPALAIGLILHEYAHIWMAKSLGMKTERVQITGAGAAAIMGTYAFEKTFDNGNLEVKVAAAGPLMSATLAIVGFIGATVSLICGLPAVSAAFAEFAFINAVLGIFNMLPLFPLDGGRVLRGFLHQHIFQHLEDKERLNILLSILPRVIYPIALGLIGGGILGGPTLVIGILMLITIRSLKGEVENSKRYIEFLKRKYNYRPDADWEGHVRSIRYDGQDWWTDLGLQQRPRTFRAVKQAYRRKIQTAHPDKGGTDREMQIITRAYANAKQAFGV